MPRPSKGARLWLRKAQYDRKGRLTHAAVRHIKDGEYRESTGSRADDRGGAEKALGEYITGKHLAQAETGLRPPAAIPVGDVLALYARDVAPKHARPSETGRRITELLTFFGDKVLSDVTGQLCRAYVDHRGADGALAVSLRTCVLRSTIIAGKGYARQSSRWSFQMRLRPANDG
jgi:hypothetical protein